MTAKLPIDLRPQCKAISKAAGRQCLWRAVPGAVVCRYHGGAAPQVLAAAARRVSLAEAFEHGDRRPAWQILADALHAADTLMLDARVKLTEGEQITVEQLDKFLEALDRAQRFAKVVLDAGVDERQTRAAESMTAQLIGYVDRAMAAVGLTSVVQGQVRKAIAAEIRSGR